MARQHLAVLYRTAFRPTGRRQDAEDLVQDTYLRAWRSRHTYRPGTNSKAWLFTILHNRYIDRGRTSSRMGWTVGSVDDAERLCVTHETPETVVMAGVMDAEVRRALLKISKAFRACLLLAEFEECSYQEIAEILGIPRGTVMSRVFRARRLMRRHLSAYGRQHRYLKAG